MPRPHAHMGPESQDQGKVSDNGTLSWARMPSIWSHTLRVYSISIKLAYSAGLSFWR